MHSIDPMPARLRIFHPAQLSVQHLEETSKTYQEVESEKAELKIATQRNIYTDPPPNRVAEWEDRGGRIFNRKGMFTHNSTD